MQKIRSVLSSHSDDVSTSSSTDPRVSSESGRTSGTYGDRTSGSPTTAASTRVPTHHSGRHSGSDNVQNPAGKLPVREGVSGRSEETGGNARVSGGTPAFTDPHSSGHPRSHDLSNEFSLNEATHDHSHLQAVKKDKIHRHQVEEVTRQKEHERHIHHVQHHVQPVLDVEDHEERRQHRENIVPTTHISEKHGSTKEDIAAFHGLKKHKDEVIDHGIVDRKVVDLGETVNERVHHHVHNVVQPILETEHHEHETIHTVIPVKHVSHEAPTVHESLTHNAVSKADFLKQGGQLGSTLSHHEAGVLTEGGCDRNVDGVGERLAKELGLKSGTRDDQMKADTRI